MNTFTGGWGFWKETGRSAPIKLDRASRRSSALTYPLFHLVLFFRLAPLLYSLVQQISMDFLKVSSSFQLASSCSTLSCDSFWVLAWSFGGFHHFSVWNQACLVMATGISSMRTLLQSLPQLWTRISTGPLMSPMTYLAWFQIPYFPLTALIWYWMISRLLMHVSIRIFNDEDKTRCNVTLYRQKNQKPAPKSRKLLHQ